MNVTSTPEVTVTSESPFMLVFMFVSLLSVVGGSIYIIYISIRFIYTLISSTISAKIKGDYNLQSNIPNTSEV